MLSFKSSITAFDRYFFEPKPTESIAVFRILWGMIIAVYFISDIGNINDFYGPHAILSLNTVKENFNYPHMNVFHLLSGTYEAVYFLFGLFAVGIIGTILGLYTRTSLIIVLICMTSFHQRNIWLLSSSECLMRIVTILLVCSPCGHTLSLDAVMGRKDPAFKRPGMWAPWALRLIQIQIAVVYVWTVWHKIKGEDWFDGSAVYYATRLEAMKNFSIPVLLDSPLFLQLATWGTLALELSLGVLIWFKEFRKPLIIAGLIFHMGIEWTMSIPFFEINMAALLILFFTPEEVKYFVASKKNVFINKLDKIEMDPYWKTKIMLFAGKEDTVK